MKRHLDVKILQQSSKKWNIVEKLRVRNPSKLECK